ncbi:SsrA-binding protein [bacterium SM23_31]|nr:MAG: SsrA-binding protein [bacterium SM23_31]
MDKDKIRVAATNRKARHDYIILSTVEAGIVLQGTEVKSIRQGNINLKDSYAELRSGEFFLVGVHIGKYPPANRFNHEPERDRKLLLTRREINKLGGKTTERGITLVPLQVYIKNGLVKVELGLAKGKKLYDKREAIAKRDFEREKEREWKMR